MHNKIHIAAFAALLGWSGITLAQERQQLAASELSDEDTASLEGTPQRVRKLAETIDDKRNEAPAETG